jgi:hypothetical protein
MSFLSHVIFTSGIILKGHFVENHTPRFGSARLPAGEAEIHTGMGLSDFGAGVGKWLRNMAAHFAEKKPFSSIVKKHLRKASRLGMVACPALSKASFETRFLTGLFAISYIAIGGSIHPRIAGAYRLLPAQISSDFSRHAQISLFLESFFL